MRLAQFWSGRSRASNDEARTFLGPEKEWLVQYCEKKIETMDIDYFIFGHRHLTIDYRLSNSSRYINLGEWMHQCSYAQFDGKTLEIKFFENADGKLWENI